MSHPSPPADLLDDVVRALTPAFRLDQRVAATPERAVYHAWDRVLKRSVAFHVHLAPDSPGRAWFLRETETLAALDIRRFAMSTRPGWWAPSPTAPPTGSMERAWPRLCAADRARSPWRTPWCATCWARLSTPTRAASFCVASSR